MTRPLRWRFTHGRRTTRTRNVKRRTYGCAERRAGELLKELARAERGGDRRSEVAKNQTPNDWEFEKSPYAKAHQANGISSQTASRYQKLAKIPSDEFEAALRDPVVKPSTARSMSNAATQTTSPLHGAIKR